MKKKKKILFITHQCNYFVDNNASFYRMYKNLNYFHNNDKFEVYVLQPNKESNNENKNLKKNIKTFYFKDLKIFGLRLVHFLDFNPFFILKLRQILNSYKLDLIHFDFPYGINITRLLVDFPIVYNAYNVEYTYYKEIGKYFRKIPIFLRKMYTCYIFLLEKYAVQKSNLVNAFSKDDLREFIKIYKISKEKVFPNEMGIKSEIYQKKISKNRAKKDLNININKFVIIFHGFYFINDANKEAINIIKKKIAPSLKNKDILFLIAGKMPDFKDKKNIRFLGFVKDLENFLYAGDIAIVPIFRGSGVRIKMIDYISANIPMITTKKAIHGLYYQDKIHGYVIGENVVEEMIEKILFLKKHPEKIDFFKKNIDQLIKKRYNWESILSKLKRKYIELLEKGL